MASNTASQVVAADNNTASSEEADGAFSHVAELCRALLYLRQTPHSETMRGESSRAAGVLAGGLLHSRSADETALQRHWILRFRAPRRFRQPSARVTSSFSVPGKEADREPAVEKVDTGNILKKEADREPAVEKVDTGNILEKEADREPSVEKDDASDILVLQIDQVHATGMEPSSTPGTQVDDDTRSSTLERFLNMEQFGKVIGLLVALVTQMSGASEEQKNISLCFLGAVFVVCAMELLVMPYCKVKWEVIIFGIASNSAMLIALYLAVCILKPGWLIWYGFVIVFIIANAWTISDELKTMFTWCCEKVGLVIKYVSDKVSKPLKDQALPPARVGP